MKLSVKNFGPIKKAENIEIKPLTVFAGPSNTGKTYLATLIYSLFKMAHGSGKGEGFPTFLTYIAEKDKSFLDYLLDTKKVNKKNLDKIKEKVASVIFPAMMKNNQSLWKKEMLRCFGDAGNVLLKRKIEYIVSDAQGKYRLNINSPDDSWTKESFNSTVDEFWEKHQDEKYLAAILSIDSIISKIYGDIFNPYSGNIYYLPAIRGGIMQSHRGLASAAVKQAPMIGLRESPMTPMFNGVLADFLEGLLMVNSPRRRYYRRPDKGNGGLSEIERYLEKHVLGGKINVSDTEAQYPDFRYSFDSKKNGDISLTQASSMVSELAPLSLFIRHYLKKGDTLIFEEPEAHLHPEAQRAISEVIVMLVKAGVCVIVTTHSDYILEQLGNFAHAGAMPERKRKNVKLLGKPIKELFLKPDDIALYDFEQKTTGTKTTVTYVKRKPYDPEAGIIPKEHDKVLGELHNETVDLLNEKNGDE